MTAAGRDPRRSRGYRNRNPGNIEFNPANKWQGQIGLGDEWLPPEQRRFARFESHAYGIRALAMLLTTYQDRHGLRTIREIISRWAPAHENDTEAYIAHVAQLMGRAPDAPLDLHRHEDLRALVVAIITHECGGNPYDDATIDEGLRLAGVPRPVATLRDAAATGTGRSAITVAAVASAAATAAPAIEALGSLSPWVGVALVVAATAVAALVLLTQRRRPA
jgi:hypothetical protein